MQHFWKRLPVAVALRIGLGIIIGLISLGGGGARPAYAATWYVSLAGTGNDSNDCLGTSTPCLTINAVLAKPGFTDNDIIRITQGTITGAGDQVVLITRPVQLFGGYSSSFGGQVGLTTLDGENVRAGLVISPGVTLSINRFTLRRAGGAMNGGAGIYNLGTAVIEQSIFSDNATGLYVGGATTLQLSTVTSNTTGIVVASGLPATVTVRNVTLVYNTTGLQNLGSGLALNNATINANYAGGALVSSGGTTLLQNSILAGNATNCSLNGGVVTSGGYNLVGNNIGCFTPLGSDIQNDDPGLAPLRNNGGATTTQALFPGSPAVNKGSPLPVGTTGGCATTDQRGVTRPQLSVCDIGAYESNQVIRTYLPRVTK